MQCWFKVSRPVSVPIFGGFGLGLGLEASDLVLVDITELYTLKDNHITYNILINIIYFLILCLVCVHYVHCVQR